MPDRTAPVDQRRLRRTYTVALLLGALATPPGAPAARDTPFVELSAADVFAGASASVVFIVTESLTGEYVGQGSGVVIRPGVVVTNCHVLRGAKDVGALHRDTFYPAPRVIDSNIGRDLCLLAVPALPAAQIRTGSSTALRVGQKVFAIGAPYGLDLGVELTLSEGLVSALRRHARDAYPMIQTSAPMSPGSSGGALLAGDGSLIGITSFQHGAGQNLNFAVPVEWVLEFPVLQ